MKKLLTALCLTGVVCNLSTANACTTLIIKDNQGGVYQGRTMEFGDGLPQMYLNYYPVGSKFVANSTATKTPLNYDAKYALLEVVAQIDKTKQKSAVDGINSQGLTVTVNAFGLSKGTDTKNTSKVIDTDSLAQWILSQFATVDEVKQEIGKQSIWFEPTILMGLKFPLHIAVFDRSAKGIVIEFVDGKLQVNDNPVGVMTNAPEFTWHLTNLNNYTSLSNVGNGAAKWGGETLQQVDIGGNTLGLPSDDTSTGRFVRAAFYSNFATKPDPVNGVATIGKIMNKFDRIKGVTETNTSSTEALANPSSNKSYPSEWTVFTTLRDLNNTTYYIRTESSLNYAQFDLNTLKKNNPKPFSLSFSDLYKPDVVKQITGSN